MGALERLASVILPHILYLNTVILLISSLTIELARFSLSRGAFQRSACAGFGAHFCSDCLCSWAGRGLESNSYFADSTSLRIREAFSFYFLTGVHGLHLLGGCWRCLT